MDRNEQRPQFDLIAAQHGVIFERNSIKIPSNIDPEMLEMIQAHYHDMYHINLNRVLFMQQFPNWLDEAKTLKKALYISKMIRDVLQDLSYPYFTMVEKK